MNNLWHVFFFSFFFILSKETIFSSVPINIFLCLVPVRKCLQSGLKSFPNQGIRVKPGLGCLENIDRYNKAIKWNANAPELNFC